MTSCIYVATDSLHSFRNRRSNELTVLLLERALEGSGNSFECPLARKLKYAIGRSSSQRLHRAGSGIVKRVGILFPPTVQMSETSATTASLRPPRIGNDPGFRPDQRRVSLLTSSLRAISHAQSMSGSSSGGASVPQPMICCADAVSLELSPEKPGLTLQVKVGLRRSDNSQPKPERSTPALST
jgi:hypothetical protein